MNVKKTKSSKKIVLKITMSMTRERHDSLLLNNHRHKVSRPHLWVNQYGADESLR